MLAIFDTFDDAARELLRSLDTAGIDVTAVVVRYQGELPEGALCPFTEYTGLDRSGRPLFFNEVPVPPWCEIRQGQEAYGEILRDGEVIGRIFYEPNSFRQVENVDWLLPDGSASHTDHYDRYGNRFATSYFAGGAVAHTVYSGPGEWSIEIDRGTKAVTMRSAHRVLTFESLTDFVCHFLDERGLGAARLATEPVLINSLSHPLFVMRKRAAAPNTTLFWQEPMPGDVPGNMALELGEPRALARIVFCDERLRQKVAERYPGSAVEFAYLSHLGQFAEKRGFELRRTFTLTNSDELPGLAQLLEDFPEVTFSVAALTLMSERLHELKRQHPNLVLTPTISQGGIRAELERASVYLDLNAGAHVLEVVKAAYYLNLVVFALAPNAKAPEHSRVLSSTQELAAQLAQAVGSSQGRARALDELHTQRGPLSTPADYRRMFA